MAKSYSIIVIIGITLALISAETPRFEKSKHFSIFGKPNNRKLFARQEQAQNVTPYPPAGVTPEIPFDLPTETEVPSTGPDQTYGPPDVTYLPPEQTPDQSYGPPDAEEIPSITEPDNTYIPPTFENKPAIEDPESEELPPSESNLNSANLIQPRKKIRAHLRSAQLRFRTLSPRFHLAALQLRNSPVQSRFNTVDITHSEPVLSYTLHQKVT